MTTSLLAPVYEVTLGSQLWSEQLLSLDVQLAPCPLLDVVVARLPVDAPLDAAAGDDAIVHVDGGEGGEDVFTGRIDSVRRGLTAIEVRALDAGGALAAFRPATTLEHVTVATAITTLCDDAGVETGDLEDGPTLSFYVADPGRTALAHVARLATWSGALARVNGLGQLDASIVGGSSPDVALRYGREVLQLDVREAAGPIESFVVAGEAGVGTDSDPNALRPTSDFFGGSRPDGPSATSVWRFEPALRTPAAAQTAGANLTRLYRSSRQQAALLAFLQPSLRPGTVVQVKDVPGGVSGGPFWVERVRHRVSPAGATTTAKAWQGGDAFDPAALLGSLLGALGGLL